MTPKRVDANHPEIRDGMRKRGYFVVDTHELGRGFPDLVVTTKRYHRIVLLEVKNERGALNEDEKKFHAEFPGPCRVVKTLEGAIAAVDEFDREAA